MKVNAASVVLATALLLTASSAHSVESPVQRVVQLLTEMKAQVEKEGSEDEIAYNKYNCWCETNKGAKTEAVKNAETKISELEAFIEEAAGLEAQLKTEIETLTADIADDTDALETATALRAKEEAEFKAEEADLKESVGALREAVTILGKVQLLQKRDGAAAAAKVSAALMQLQHLVGGVRARPGRFRSVMQRDLWDVLSSLNASPKGSAFLPRRMSTLAEHGELLPWEKTEEEEGAEAKPNDLEGAAAGTKSYGARSSQIYGLLSQMKAEFESNLAAAQKEELAAVVAFQKLRAAKLAEIAAATKNKEQKEAQLADTMLKAAEAKEEVEATKEALGADQKFLLFLEETCTTVAEEYQGRVKNRNDEVTALGEAIKILTEDDTRDLFSRTMSFLQTSRQSKSVGARVGGRRGATAADTAQRQAVDKAMKRLLSIAKKHRDWVLASLAVRVRLDEFVKVKAAIDKMTADLQSEQKAEYEKWETCKADIDEAEDTVKEKTHEKTDLEDKQLDLENTIATLEADRETLKTEVADMEISLKKAGEDRKAENQLFQQSVADQRATINILNKALARLKEFYQTKGGSLAQRGARQEPGAAVAPPPPKPKAFEKSAAAGGVLQLMSKIIADATRGETQLVVDEQHAQEAYATFASSTSASIAQYRELIVEKTALAEEAASEKSATAAALLNNGEELRKLSDLLRSHHLACDFLLKFFDVRQQARKEELAALAEAKAILSGADFGKAMEAADAAEES